jgi:methylated-DNA-[protein]-cysteine S-methyltransferase
VIDLHCHILHGIDDGARDVDDALAMARQAHDDGIEVVCATPHIRVDHDVRIHELDDRVAELQRAIDSAGLSVRIARGGEVAQPIVESLTDEELATVALDEVRRELDEYFEGKRTSFEIPIDWRLHDGFSRRVLRATARIPFGKVLTYQQVAAKAGSPRGYRAAGNALGSNRMPIVVPCHRVVASGGKIGGYTGGLERKHFLLGLEGVE